MKPTLFRQPSHTIEVTDQLRYERAGDLITSVTIDDLKISISGDEASALNRVISEVTTKTIADGETELSTALEKAMRHFFKHPKVPEKRALALKKPVEPEEKPRPQFALPLPQAPMRLNKYALIVNYSADFKKRRNLLTPLDSMQLIETQQHPACDHRFAPLSDRCNEVLRILINRGQAAMINEALEELATKINRIQYKKPLNAQEIKNKCLIEIEKGFFNMLANLARGNIKKRAVWSKRTYLITGHTTEILSARYKPHFDLKPTYVRDEAKAASYYASLSRLDPCDEALLYLLLGRKFSSKKFLCKQIRPDELEEALLEARTALEPNSSEFVPSASTETSIQSDDRSAGSFELASLGSTPPKKQVHFRLGR